jgi:serine/threonine protein kinase
MLSSKESAKAVVKVVDFGCARSDLTGEVGNDHGDHDEISQTRRTANTPAYSAPEVLNSRKQKGRVKPIEASFDMWAVGVILYVMLTGVHPFDLYGNATDEEIEKSIVNGKKPPLGKSPLTAHLSPDAVNLIEQLLQWNPRRRLTAQQLLENPWVRGETARTSKIADSDKRLSAYRAFKTKLEAKVFADMISASEGGNDIDISKRTSLIERAFQKFDPDNRGYIPAKELRKLAGDADNSQDIIQDDESLSLSGFSDILAENMNNKYFPKGHTIYQEGKVGNAMFFLNSGSIEVVTKDGYRSVRHSGEFFGEGALLDPKKIRSATIRSLTPVHVIEISRDYFEKYVASDSGEFFFNGWYLEELFFLVL